MSVQSFRGACVWPGESTLLMCYGWLLLSSQFVFKLEQTTLQFSPLDARIAGPVESFSAQSCQRE